MDSQSLLTPSYVGRQITGSAPGLFYTNSSCYWQVGPPSEWTDNSVLKIRITKLEDATCTIASGGTMMTANKEQNCKLGDEISFTYSQMSKPQFNIFLVSYATFLNKGKPVLANNGTVVPDSHIEVIGHIEFEYWAENVVLWTDFVFYGFIGILGFGLFTCCLLLMIYRTTLEEEMSDLTRMMWKLKGKSKEYLQENAP